MTKQLFSNHKGGNILTNDTTRVCYKRLPIFIYSQKRKKTENNSNATLNQSVSLHNSENHELNDIRTAK